MTPSGDSVLVVSIIFGLTYLALAAGEIPGLYCDRSGIALVGAAAMLVCGALTLPDAARAVDYDTLILLFGMMVVAAHLRMASYSVASSWAVKTTASDPAQS